MIVDENCDMRYLSKAKTYPNRSSMSKNFYNQYTETLAPYVFYPYSVPFYHTLPYCDMHGYIIIFNFQATSNSNKNVMFP